MMSCFTRSMKKVMVNEKEEEGTLLDFAGQRNSIETHTIFELFNQINLPAQSLDLPGAETKGDDGAKSEADGDRAPTPPTGLCP